VSYLFTIESTHPYYGRQTETIVSQTLSEAHAKRKQALRRYGKAGPVMKSKFGATQHMK